MAELPEDAASCASPLDAALPIPPNDHWPLPARGFGAQRGVAARAHVGGLGGSRSSQLQRYARATDPPHAAPIFNAWGGAAPDEPVLLWELRPCPPFWVADAPANAPPPCPLDWRCSRAMAPSGLAALPARGLGLLAGLPPPPQLSSPQSSSSSPQPPPRLALGFARSALCSSSEPSVLEYSRLLATLISRRSCQMILNGASSTPARRRRLPPRAALGLGLDLLLVQRLRGLLLSRSTPQLGESHGGCTGSTVE